MLLKEGVIVSPFFAHHNKTSSEKQYAEWLKENAKIIHESQGKLKEFGGARFSREVLSGALLQIVDMAIKLYGIQVEEAEIPEWIKQRLENLSNKNQITRLAKYYLGRVIWGLPIGLVVHGARNQFNHFDETANNPVTIFVLEKISEENHNIKEILESSENRAISDTVVYSLGWYDKSIFDEDFEALLNL